MALAAYYCYFASVGLRAGLTHDDLMNAHRAVLAPWPSLIKDCLFFFLPSDQYRPVGAVFYRICRDLFGFTPLPLHAGMLLLWGVSLVLVYDAMRRLVQSREIALLTALFVSHHANRPFYYFNSGFCYDVLCQLFFFATLAYYLRARENGGRPGEAQLLVLTGLYILALGSKEMAASLPVVLLAYEWLHPDGAGRDWRFPLLSAAMAAAFAAGRVLAHDGVGTLDGYRITLRPVLYLESWSQWLGSLLYAPAVPIWMAAAFVAACLVLAWLSFDHGFRVGVVLALAGALPLAFVRPVRGLEAACIPMTGLALLAAWWITRLSLVVPWRGRAPALFALILVLLADLHARKTPPADAMLAEGVSIGLVQKQIQLQGPMTSQSRVLFVEDPFPEPYGFATTFLLQIDYGAGLAVDRADKLATPPDWAKYDHVLSWQQGRLVSLKPGASASRRPVVPQ